VTARQFLTIRRPVAEEGSKGVVHGLTGRSPVNRLSDEVREKILGLRRGQYNGFNDHHFGEKLREEQKIEVSRATVRRLRRAAGISSTRMSHDTSTVRA